MKMEDSSRNTQLHLAEAGALLRRINACSAPPRTEQQRVAEAVVQLDLPRPQYEEGSEDERGKEHRPPKRWSMGGRPKTIGNTKHPATRGGNKNELKKLGSPIQFTTRIGRRNTQGKGHPSALTSIAHTTEVWERLPFFRKDAKNPSQKYNLETPSQDATQHLRLRYQQSPNRTEETGTRDGSAEMRNQTQESSGKWEQQAAEEGTGEESISQSDNSGQHHTDPDWMASS
ncbi:hypothetical protein BDD12DRAFT_884929 [Trichophaea hybrida]|nr:hypothetical protein BDD12DRAFT_884929 [Trichophaea hybrida]